MHKILETERILLRKFTLEDAPAVLEFNSNPEVQRYTGDEIFTSLEQAEAIIKKLIANDYKDYGYGRWAAVYKPDGKVIGFAGLKFLLELDATDIGYRFLPEYWGKGIATEISKAIIEYGFKELNLERIIGIVMADNPASSRVLEKCGMKFFKVDEYYGDGGNHNWYEIFKADL